MPDSTCSVDGCEKEPRSNTADWCKMHYHRWYRHGDVNAVGVTQSSTGRCVQCDEPFGTPNQNGKRAFCDSKCATRFARQTKQNLECWACGESFPMTKGRPSAKSYCSGDCRLDGKSIHARAKRYAVTPERMRDLLRDHDGCCEICGEAETWKGTTRPRYNRLSIDHDHRSGAVRGLLCAQCNHAIGKMRDDPEILRRAAAYLEKSARPDFCGNHATWLHGDVG